MYSRKSLHHEITSHHEQLSDLWEPLKSAGHVLESSKRCSHCFAADSLMLISVGYICAAHGSRLGQKSKDRTALQVLRIQASVSTMHPQALAALSHAQDRSPICRSA